MCVVDRQNPQKCIVFAYYLATYVTRTDVENNTNESVINSFLKRP